MTNLLFDYDGTIHESMKIYGPAFRKINSELVDKGLIEKTYYDDKSISKYLGMSVVDMWNDYAAHLGEDEKKYYGNKIGQEMYRLVKSGHGKLYEGAEETLASLKKRGHNLIFLSNCKEEYMEVHREYFKLDRFFSDFYTSEAFDFLPKYEIFKKIKEKYSGDYIIIGDRKQDMEIARVHKLKSIACKYGYGSSQELRAANFSINKIKDILDLNL